MEQQNFAKAEECLGRLLKSEKHKKDPYGWQALGTLHLLRAQAASQSQQVRLQAPSCWHASRVQVQCTLVPAAIGHCFCCKQPESSHIAHLKDEGLRDLA